MHRIVTGSPFEAALAYSRAVVKGDWCFVSGTTGYDYATMTMPDDPCQQARNCLRTVFATLEQDLGSGWVGKLQLDHKINGYDAQLGAIQFNQPAADGTAKINAQRYKGETTSDSADSSSATIPPRTIGWSSATSTRIIPALPSAE